MKIVLVIALFLFSSSPILRAQTQGVSTGPVSFESDANGDVRAIHYTGDSAWLLDRKDERANWQRHGKLSRITLTHNYVDRRMIEYITTLGGVVDLEISGAEVMIERNALEPLRKMRRMKRLHIDDNAERDFRSWEFVAHLEFLETLVVYGPSVNNIDLSLDSLRSLKHLSLSSINESTAKRLAVLRDLETVDCGRVDSITTVLEAVVSCKKIKGISAYSRHIAKSDLELLTKVPLLVNLNLSGKSVESLLPIANLGQLKYLSVNFAELPRPDQVVAWDRLKRLEYLSLRSREFPNSEKWEFLSSMPLLEELELTSSITKQYSINALKGHAKLKVLRLGAFDLSDEDIDVLESLPSLELLEIGNDRNSSWYTKVRARLPKLHIRHSS
jgi:hypothetical protein